MHPRVRALAMVAAQKRSAVASCRSTACGQVEHPATLDASTSGVVEGEGEADVGAVIAET
jgi:hypothetical protein